MTESNPPSAYGARQWPGLPLLSGFFADLDQNFRLKFVDRKWVKSRWVKRILHLLVKVCLQNRPTLVQNHSFSYINRIPQPRGYSPVTQGCDLYTKSYEFGRVWPILETETLTKTCKILLTYLLLTHLRSTHASLRQTSRRCERETRSGVEWGRQNRHATKSATAAWT